MAVDRAEGKDAEIAFDLWVGLAQRLLPFPARRHQRAPAIEPPPPGNRGFILD